MLSWDIHSLLREERRGAQNPQLCSHGQMTSHSALSHFEKLLKEKRNRPERGQIDQIDQNHPIIRMGNTDTVCVSVLKPCVFFHPTLWPTLQCKGCAQLTGRCLYLEMIKELMISGYVVKLMKY